MTECAPVAGTLDTDLSLDALVDRAARVASESASHAAEVDTDEGFPAADIELLADAGS